MAPAVKQGAGDVPFSAASSRATYDDIEILNRQIVALQAAVAAQHDSLASGDRMFAAINRSLIVQFRLLGVLWIAVMVLLVITVWGWVR